MHTVTYLNDKGLESLVEEFSIIAKEYPHPEGSSSKLVVLNYDQIRSPKTHPIIKECRGLIVEYVDELGRWYVVSRSFDRFFNLGEADAQPENIDFSCCDVVEKVDGSLIKIYEFNSEWHISTRGTAFAESSCNGWATFRELVLKALDLSDEEFQEKCWECLDSYYTYIFELTCPENRIVRPYEGYTLWYLGARHNISYEYGDHLEKIDALRLGAREIKLFDLHNAEQIVEATKGMQTLDEGFVVVDIASGAPICKVKSPLYVHVHRMRGEVGLTPKRIYELIAINETEEYLTYFPEDSEKVHSVLTKVVSTLVEAEELFEEVKKEESQKEFALKVKDKVYSDLMFLARREGTSPSFVFWGRYTNTQRARMIQGIAEKC